MGKLFEGFNILCINFDHVLNKMGDILQWRILIKKIWYSLQILTYSIHFCSVILVLLIDFNLESTLYELRKDVESPNIASIIEL